MRKKGIITAILLLCLALLGATACSSLGSSNSKVELQSAQVKRADLTVSVTGDGSLETSRQARLTFGSSGKVDKIVVTEGDHVTKGQVLAQLDTTFLEQTVKTAEQAVENAEQGVSTAEQSVKTAELTVEAKQQSVKAAELTVTAGELAIKAADIDVELAQNNYQKMITPYPYTTFRFNLPDALDVLRIGRQKIKEAQEELRKATQGEPFVISEITNKLAEAQESLNDAENKLAFGLGEGVQPSNIDYWTLRNAQLQIDKAQLASDKAKNDLDNLKNNLAIAKNNLENAQNSLDIARTNQGSTVTNLAKAKNELDKVKDDLEKATIIAPFDGVIAKVGAKEGDTVTSPTVSPQTIIQLIDPSTMELVVELDEIDIPEVRLNQKAVITLDAIPDTKFTGKVIAIYPLPTTVGGVVLYNTKVSFDVPENSGIKVGMSASADLIINERNNVLLVPSRAIEQDNQGNTFVKVTVNGQTQERPVVTGISDGISTEIVQGLTEGETVVIELKTSAQTGGGMFGF